MEALELALALAVDLTLTYRVFKWDIGRIGPRELARSWNTASLWSALFLCQRWCLIVHFTRTRRSLLGFALGVGFALAITLVVGLLVALLHLATT